MWGFFTHGPWPGYFFHKMGVSPAQKKLLYTPQKTSIMPTHRIRARTVLKRSRLKVRMKKNKKYGFSALLWWPTLCTEKTSLHWLCTLFFAKGDIMEEIVYVEVVISFSAPFQAVYQSHEILSCDQTCLLSFWTDDWCWYNQSDFTRVLNSFHAHSLDLLWGNTAPEVTRNGQQFLSLGMMHTNWWF